MENNIQTKVLSNLHYALNLNGFLFLGSSENISILDKNFEEVSSKWKIYKNIQTEPILNVNRGNTWRVEKDGAIRFPSVRSRSSLEDKVAKSINKLLMDSMGAVSVCVDDNFEIIHASGKLKKYIQYPEEGYSNNLIKMLPDELNIPISTGIRKISMTQEGSIEKEIKLVSEDKLKQLRLIISSFNIVSLNSRSFLITIIEESERQVTEEDRQIISPVAITNRDQMLELKEALNETRENLQATIEELETSNEEMQATNEELLASNEELQSTNEELQSLNEELHTVNAELQEKNEQLIELNSDVENLMKNINIGTIFLDRGFQIRKYTPAITKHFQLRIEDIGRSISHFSGTLDGEVLIQYSKEVIKTLRPYKNDIQDTNGNWFTMEIYPYRSDEDLIQGVVINFIDISEIKNAISKKEEFNSFMNHLMEFNPSIIYIYDLETQKNTYCSSNITKFFGISESDITEMNKNNLIGALIYEDDIDKVLKHHEKLRTISPNEISQIEYRLKHKTTGEIIWVLSSDRAHEINDDGTVRTIMGSANIITNSKEMEFKLKESEERFRLAVNSNKSGLWEWSDVSTDNAWYSNEFFNLLDFQEKDLNHQFSSFVNLIHPNHISVFRNAMEDHVEDNLSFEEEIQLKTKNRGYVWFRVNGQMQFDTTSKNIKKIVGTLVDINEKKQSEQKMKELNIELERFAYLASHDLKEPLRTITSFSKLFREEYDKKLDHNSKTYLQFIEDASSRMINLTEDLLAYSQLTNKSLNFQKVNLNEAIQQIKLDLNEIIANKKAEISVNDLPNINCDKTQIKQLFQNLISNSLKYVSLEKTPMITIGYNYSLKFHEFFVRDNGIGIAEKHHTTIFDVFKRLHSTEEYEGTGIGLANCKRIVDNHNGEIWVESKENKGSTFYFRFPKQ